MFALESCHCKVAVPLQYSYEQMRWIFLNAVVLATEGKWRDNLKNSL